MNLPGIFFNWQSLALALCIYALTEGVRRFVQAIWKGWRTNKLYTEFVLWVLPMAIGTSFALLVSTFPWPVLLESRSSRVVYASVLGMFCGLVYNRTKEFLRTEGYKSSGSGGV